MAENFQDSLEDRICAAGKHDEFVIALNNFKKSSRSKEKQQIFYDALEGLGAGSEEADEFVTMIANEDEVGSDETY